VQAWKAREDGRPAEALALLARAADEYPRDKELAFWAGVVAMPGGPSSTASAAPDASGPAQAVPWLERAVALDPGWAPATSALVDALARSGRIDEAIGRARAWAARGPDAAAIRQLVGVLHLAGRPAEAEPEARRLLAIDPSPEARGWVAMALTLADRPEEAEALLKPLAAPGAPLAVVVALADALEAQGRRREALALVGGMKEPAYRAWFRFVVLMGDRDPSASRRAGREVVELGVLAAVVTGGAAHLRDEPLLEAAAAKLPPGPSPARTEYEALRAWLHGDRARALDLLRSLEGAVELIAKRHWWRARVAFELDHVDEGDAALAAFEHGQHAGCWRGWGRAQLLVWAAEAHARRGDRAKALQALDRLEALWPRADRDLAQLEDARALRRRLAASVPPPAGGLR
jgi:tetratricopeptide (TPR) repeat protein